MVEPKPKEEVNINETEQTKKDAELKEGDSEENGDHKELDAELVQKLLNQQQEKDHKYWYTQPVLRNQEQMREVKVSGPIDVEKQVSEISDHPYKLPDGYDWAEINMADDKEVEKVYTLLAENYVEDEDNMFRFDYSPQFLKWALTPPDYFKTWIVGVKVKKTGKLVGFITGVPVHMRLEKSDTDKKMAEINFLCVNKKLRNNRLAPVLIKEITRRVNRENIWQAVYTAGVVVPTPLTKARYYHRSLNPKKLIEINFSSLSRNLTLARVVKLYKLPEETNIPGLRPMEKGDVPTVYKLLSAYLKNFNLYQRFTQDEVRHFFLPRDEVIYTYVVETNKVVTDFFSFYYLPSSIIKHPKYNKLRAVYSYYNVSTTKEIGLTKLMENALIVAKQLDFDVFNALDIMENTQFLKELKFSPGDGNLHYYLYNWKIAQQLEAKDLGMVLV